MGRCSHPDLHFAFFVSEQASTIIDFLLHQSHESALSIMDISKRTSIVAEDIVYTLNQLGILKIINGVYFIAAERSLLEKLAKKYPVKEPRVDPSKLHWTPFLTDVKRLVKLMMLLLLFLIEFSRCIAKFNSVLQLKREVIHCNVSPRFNYLLCYCTALIYILYSQKNVD